MNDMFTDPKRDLKTERRIVLESRDDNDFKITQSDRSAVGYWYISRDRGTIPESLKGAYTTAKKAEHAVTVYLNSFARPRPIREIKS